MYRSLAFTKLVTSVMGFGFAIVTFCAGLGLAGNGNGLSAFLAFMSAALIVHWTVVALVAAKDYEEEAEHFAKQARPRFSEYETR